MLSHADNYWTLSGLVAAFFDLTLAFSLLCVSAFAFFASKFFYVFGLCLPCPCILFGYRNNNLCWHKLLIGWPRRKIYDVKKLAYTWFFCDLVGLMEQECNSNGMFSTDRNLEKGVLEVEGEPTSNSFSGLRLENVVDKESGHDVKGKKITNQKQKSGIRRRRKTTLGNGKPASASLSDKSQPTVVGYPSLPYSDIEVRSKVLGCSASEIEDGYDAQTGIGVGESRHGFEPSGTCEESSEFGKDSPSIQRFTSNNEDKVSIARDEADRIRMLEQALEEGKNVHAALLQELEKERAAAATAADEAMAMILRLQEDKASIEMEARQYQRMIEEKSAYDEDEMDILKEILLKREKENRILEKELEAYREMVVLGDELPEHDYSSPSAEKQNHILSVVKEMASRNQDLGTSLGLANMPGASSNVSFTDCEHGIPEKTVILVGEGKTHDDDNSILCEGVVSKATQNCIVVGSSPCGGNGLEQDVEFGDHVCIKVHSLPLDMEPTVYDVHVIDYKNDLQKENVKDDGFSSSPSSDKKNLLSDLGKNSFSTVSNERLKIDNEIEWLQERLQIVLEDENLTFSADQRERINAQIKLMEEIVSQLPEFQMLKEPGRQASLPPSSSSMVSSNKRLAGNLSDQENPGSG